MNPVARLVAADEDDPGMTQVRELLGLGGLAQLLAAGAQAGVEGVGAAGGRVASGSPGQACFSCIQGAVGRRKSVQLLDRQARHRRRAASARGAHGELCRPQ